MQPCLSQTGKPGSRNGKPVKVIRYIYSLPVVKYEAAMLLKVRLKVPGDAEQKN